MQVPIPTINECGKNLSLQFVDALLACTCRATFSFLSYNFVKSHMEGASIVTSAKSLKESILKFTKATGSCSISLLFKDRSSNKYHSK